MLQNDPLVKPGGVTFVSKERALQIMKKRSPELTSFLPANPFPPAFDVTPKKGEYTQRIAQAVEGVFLIAVIILLAASTILIANTIRLSIFARRREIEVMKLVGATNWFVRGPFMLEGLITGFMGSLAAVVLLFLSRELAVPSILGHIQDEPNVREIGRASCRERV